MRTLSGGEMQRVALARALVLEPDILFLDEPTSNLDVHVRRRFREDLRRVVEQLAATVVIITHEHNEALALAQRVAVIHEGRLVQIGTLKTSSSIHRTPSWPISPALRPSGMARWSSVREGLCTVRTKAGIMVQTVAEAAVGGKVAVAIRPEDVSLQWERSACRRETSSVRNTWCGVVDTVIPAGPLVEGRGETGVRAGRRAHIRGRR